MIDPEQQPSPFERGASAVGKTPGEVAQWDRVLAGLRELAVARQMLDLHAHEAAGAMRNFADAWNLSEERITAAEALEVAGHPDLVEINVRLDALYEPPA